MLHHQLQILVGRLDRAVLPLEAMPLAIEQDLVKRHQRLPSRADCCALLARRFGCGGIRDRALRRDSRKGTVAPTPMAWRRSGLPAEARSSPWRRGRGCARLSLARVAVSAHAVPCNLRCRPDCRTKRTARMTDGRDWRTWTHTVGKGAQHGDVTGGGGRDAR